MAIFSIFTCGYGLIPMILFGIIEGIIYSLKTEEEFYLTYVEGKREWL